MPSAKKKKPYTFAQGLQDRVTGWIKYGQRWYDAVSGRFTQQDTLDAPLDPANGNRYAYAAGDPINNTDPTGRDLDCVVAAGLSFGAILAFGGAVLTAPATFGGSLVIAGAAVTSLTSDLYTVQQCYLD